MNKKEVLGHCFQLLKNILGKKEKDSKQQVSTNMISKYSRATQYNWQKIVAFSRHTSKLSADQKDNRCQDQASPETHHLFSNTNMR